jgi:hypothetical protein
MTRASVLMNGHAQALLLGRIGRVAVAGRGGFGQAIAFHVAQAEQVEQALRHGLRHGRAATADVDQAGQVVFLEAAGCPAGRSPWWGCWSSA